jgi:hypothetical protein
MDKEQEFTYYIGTIAMLWNQIQSMVRLGATIANGGKDVGFWSDLLGVVKNDDIVRRMVAKIVERRLEAPEHADLRKRFIAFIDELGRMSGERNGFLHSAWSSRETDFGAEGMFGRTHGAMKADGALGHARKFCERLMKTRKDLVDLLAEIQRATSPEVHPPG